VWGTDKSSGTFCTLFHSRLLKAKSYLRKPFEIQFNYDLFNNNVSIEKKIASDPINIYKANSWDDFVKFNNSIYILNGDSSTVNIPDSAVDAVITDPPYFDFIHYSELSDFFFAWLAPVLKKRLAYFNNSDSSHNAEVQHKNPLIFSRMLANVFIKCNRVLKDNGVLVFSFHHSRPEGWAAIYQSIIVSGFSLIEFYPVHAELKGASPKYSSKSPISIDALLICKKEKCLYNRFSNPNNTIDFYVNAFSKGGFSLTENDIFVIESALSLVRLNGLKLSYEETYNYLKNKSIPDWIENKKECGTTITVC
jgi:putative DNA methylase